MLLCLIVNGRTNVVVAVVKEVGLKCRDPIVVVEWNGDEPCDIDVEVAKVLAVVVQYANNRST